MIDQTKYVRDIRAISMSKSRRLRQEDVVTEEERQSLRALIGSLRMQLYLCCAKVSVLCEANRVLHEAKQHADVAIRIQPIPIANFRFVAFVEL